MPHTFPGWLELYFQTSFLQLVIAAMSDKNVIPSVQIASGDKFVNNKGIRAIKDGIKASTGIPSVCPNPSGCG